MKALWICLTVSISFGRLVVISDIDDTIKKSNTLNPLKIFDYFVQARPFPLMVKLYQDLNEADSEVYFHYVSASYPFLYDAEKWVAKNNFPNGTYSQRESLGEKTYPYKFEKIQNLINYYKDSDFAETQFYFFGDNSSQDTKVYRDIIIKNKISKSEIFIRDVRAERVYLSPEIQLQRSAIGVNYFLSFKELKDRFEENMISNQLRNVYLKIKEDQELIPDFILKRVETKLIKKNCSQVKSRKCRQEQEAKIKNITRDYHTKS